MLNIYFNDILILMLKNIVSYNKLVYVIRNTVQNYYRI